MIIYYTDKYTGGREASRSLLKEALTAHTGDAELAAALTGAIRKGEHGKPYIDGFSCFSISHTGSIWAVLIDKHECGLDIQLERTVDAVSVAKRWYAPEDTAIIAGLARKDEASAKEEFFRVWTKREALVKALGGSVYESGLPAVSNGVAVAGGRRFKVSGIEFPGTDGQNDRALYAAVCAEAEAGLMDIAFRKL